ncbi:MULTISPECIES: dUTPase [unclassified Mammaliicoccus]|uniref:dUTPase n=1 Tax=unclassified Mammaliicoccus TaxID=2803851 RepID=UPI001EFB7CAF|nr:MULTISPECIES: dUTPase [unclassified Mammaliicoccus]
MNNQLTTDQLKELFEIQKEFDSRIPTLNLQDSKVAYVVEFFEWFNTLETFKNWKKKPGKPFDVQLDELADLLAFGLSISNQRESVDELALKRITNCKTGIPTNIHDFSFNEILGLVNAIIHLEDEVVFAFAIADQYYSVEQLIEAYKKKMERNHARQDGIVDTDKGYV